MSSKFTDNVQFERDPAGKVQYLDHLAQPFVAAPSEAFGGAQAEIALVAPVTPQGLAEQYLRAVAPLYGLEAMLPDQGAAGFADAERVGITGGSKLELAEEKELMGTTTISYQQTYNGLPVWEAGVSVTVLSEPLRVMASQSSVESDVSLPAQAALADASFAPEGITVPGLRKALGLKAKDKPTINGTPRRLIYRYDPQQRLDPSALHSSDQALEGGPPTLPLPPVPDDITTGQHHVVTEVLFTLPVAGFGDVNWRAFIEENSGSVLYLRAFVACAAGMIFRSDPATAAGGGVPGPTGAPAALNAFRSAATLEGLTSSNPQALTGQFVRIVDNDVPAAAAPTQPNPPASFHFDAKAREFAAVNAYHHCDWLFRHMQGMGFDIATYFDGTTFPVPVDACALDDALNARAPGNASGQGSEGFQFGLAGTPFPAVSIAADVRVVLHEFGHTLLWDSVHWPNFGFAHSAGDSLAAILLDPESALHNDPVRRFQTFPWILPNRNHGRDVAAGWGWDGANYGPFTSTDDRGYLAEQILSTTLFRAYRSWGGDSSDLNRRKLAARQMAYLIFRAIGSLATNPVTRTPRPEIFATALMNADIGTSNFEGYRGGTFHKVIRWSFEKQGLYQPAGAPRPVTSPGAAPAVDVFIDDGRNGEYQFQAVHWSSTDIWNRLTPTAGTHQTPVVGQTNYAYVRVKNRGSQSANNVVVRGYSANPGAGLSWPADWRPMDTPQVTVTGGIPAGGSVVVGPFRWMPQAVGHECMFMEVSADGDLSNIDARTFFPSATGPIPEWRLIPFDNNLAQRNVAPVPGGSGLRGLLSAFLDRHFLVRNPFKDTARIEVKAELPSFLAKRDWGVLVDRKSGATSFELAPDGGREVTISLRPGSDFTREELLKAEQDVTIHAFVFANGILIGGMSYKLDPKLRRAAREKKGEKLISLNDPAIEAAIRNAQLLDTERGADLFAFDAADGMAAESAFVEDVEDEESADQGATEQAALAALLAQLGVAEEISARVIRATLKKITVDFELGDALA